MTQKKKRATRLSQKRKRTHKKFQSPLKGVQPQQSETKAFQLAAASGNGMFPNFINQGGPIINTPQVYILFYGDWSSAANQKRATRLSQFTTDLLKSRYMNILSQYGCGTSGTVVNSVFVPSSDQDLSARDVHNILQTAINKKQIPEPTDPSNAYILFLDDATGVDDRSLETQPIVLCEPGNDNAFGYHDSFTTTAGNECPFAVVPGVTDSCLTNTCTKGDRKCSLHLAQTQEQRQTQITSHELAEMFSDPQPRNNPAWTSQSGENGDICNGDSATITIGSNTWTVQRMYSRRHDIDTNGSTICIVDPPNPVPAPQT
jgi:hypothetical protein